jgi:uncharacterized protein (TIGR00730 family)
MQEMKRICVFCGSSSGNKQVYREAARELGKLLATTGIELVYGGGNVGLMGILADTVIAHGGTITGVIPRSIADLELAHTGLTQLYYVETMQERKDKMAILSDAFIALPGGFGTLDELSEVLTHNQLRLFDKPIGLVNVAGFFDGLLSYLDHCVDEQFVRQEHRNNIFVTDNIPELLNQLNTFQPVHIGKWIDEIRVESANGQLNIRK